MSTFDRTRRCDITADEFDHPSVGVLSNNSTDIMLERESKSNIQRPGYRKVPHERQHYHIDSKEAATPLTSSLSDVFEVLADIAEGMPRL